MNYEYISNKNKNNNRPMYRNDNVNNVMKVNRTNISSDKIT